MTYSQPVLPALILLILAGCLMRRSGWAKWVTVGAAAGLFLWTWPPFAWLMSASLERSYPLRPLANAKVDAIVVLSSGISPPRPSQPEAMLSSGSYARCRYAAWLYRNWQQAPIVAAGGPAGESPAAAVMAAMLEAQGIPPASILREGSSSSTHENAAAAAAMLLPKGMRRIALVTEAFHMRRAEACFRKAGFLVTAAPCSFRSGDADLDWSFLVPGARPVLHNEDAFHEWLGILWYRIAGYS